jgi:hypothetical protein
MSNKSLLALATTAAALSALLAGCDKVKPPPIQLEALLTLEPKAGNQSDKQHLRDLAGSIVGYLGLEGIDSKNARVTFDESNQTYHFEIFGRLPIPPALLEQVAKGLNPLEKDRSWPAKVEVAPLAHLDTLLGSKERNFKVRANWKDVKIDAYVIRSPNPGFAMPSADPLGNGPREPKTALCMLSFTPQPALPTLEGTVEQFYGKAQENDPYALLRRHAPPGHVFSASYEVTFDEPALAKAFEEAPMAKDGKLMFQFAVIEDANVLDFAGSDSAPMDMGGVTQQKCGTKLNEKYPALARIISRVAQIDQVKSFGPARMIALPAPAK